MVSGCYLIGFFIILTSVHLLRSEGQHSSDQDEDSHKRERRDTVRTWRRKWPKKKVPYIFAKHTGYKTKLAFKGAIKEIESLSCVRFVLRQEEEDYVRVLNGKGCYSLVGRHGGRQDLSIGNGCSRKGIVIHEVMHLLGFFHEQSRLDRDDHVTIIRSNVLDDSKTQFDKYKYHEADTLGEPYDPDSIMHYGNHAFSKCPNCETIIYKPRPSKKLGQRNQLSIIDRRQLNKLYRCPQSYLDGTDGSTSEVTQTHRPSRDSETNVPQPELTCEDSMWASVNGECYFAKMMGQCNQQYQRMLQDCRRTCGFCKKKTVCKDKSAYCDYFTAIGYCESHQLIKDNCRKSCKLCSPRKPL